MWEKVGLVRDEAGLASALARLDEIADEVPELGGEARNLLCTGRLVTAAALARRESRGGHYRSDYPEPDPAWQVHLVATLGKDRRVQVEIETPLPDESLQTAAGAR
jgi:L-aspartate oxidase